uniref:Nkap_C domain-containing protein n=1 Tax=Strongyloides papillosus TaxID=174720 RepID=A0A0N5CD04_STREA
MDKKDYNSKRSHSKEKSYRERKSRSHSSEKHHHHRKESKDGQHDYWEKRRREREKIMRKPRRSIWADSPTRSEIKEIEREHKKIKEINKKEMEEFDEQIKEVVDNAGNVDIDFTEKISSSNSLVNDNVSENKGDGDDVEVIGPVIPSEVSTKFTTTSGITNYGDNISRNEGAAFAAYISQGKRIPRRGEIGLTSNQILEYEKAGYVMSGSKSLKMEAVRIRKETQVMTAEEQALMKKHNIEAKKEEEKKIMEQFKLLIQKKKGI